MVLKQKINVALVQTKPTHDIDHNLKRVDELFAKIKEEKPETNLVVLPEHFCMPCHKDVYKKHAEAIPGRISNFLSQLAKTYGFFIIGGSFAEVAESGKLYNTSLSFDDQGTLIGKHRKVHLFDIDIPDKITAKESETFEGGETSTLINIAKFGIIGEGICYDIRFPELATIAARKDCFCMCYPSAFNTTTGPLHWSLLARARAIDNQMYVIMCSPARDLSLKYPVYGHSLIVDPMGKIIVEAGEDEEIIYSQLDPQAIANCRAYIPVRTQRRFDIYKDVSQDAKISTIST